MQFLLGGPGLEFDLFPPCTCELLLPHMCELCFLTSASLLGPGLLVGIPEKRVKHMIGIFFLVENMLGLMGSLVYYTHRL